MRKARLDADLVLRDVGRRIAELRRGRGLTQEKFADLAELSWKYVQQIEAGSENLTLRSLVRLADLLGADLSELIEPPRERKAVPGRPARTDNATAAAENQAVYESDRAPKLPKQPRRGPR